MTIDLEVNEVEVKVLTSLDSVTWITGRTWAVDEGRRRKIGAVGNCERRKIERLAA
jgi:hypothetical protein